MATTSGVGGGEWEIDNDNGFVYKRPRDLYQTGHEDAPSTPAPALAPESVRLQRRRRTLLRLRAKYLLELSRWDSLSSDLLAPLPPPPAAPSRAPSASPCRVTVSSVLDDHLAEVEVQEEILEKTSQLCDEIIDICNEVEATVVDAVAGLPVWGSPRQLVSSLCSPDEQTAPLPAWGKRQPMDSLCSPAERTVPGTN